MQLDKEDPYASILEDLESDILLSPGRSGDVNPLTAGATKSSLRRHSDEYKRENGTSDNNNNSLSRPGSKIRVTPKTFRLLKSKIDDDIHALFNNENGVAEKQTDGLESESSESLSVSSNRIKKNVQFEGRHTDAVAKSKNAGEDDSNSTVSHSSNYSYSGYENGNEDGNSITNHREHYSVSSTLADVKIVDDKISIRSHNDHPISDYMYSDVKTKENHWDSGENNHQHTHTTTQLSSYAEAEGDGRNSMGANQHNIATNILDNSADLSWLDDPAYVEQLQNLEQHPLFSSTHSSPSYNSNSNNTIFLFLLAALFSSSPRKLIYKSS